MSSGYGNKQRDYDPRNTAPNSQYASTIQQHQSQYTGYSSPTGYASHPATSQAQQQQTLTRQSSNTAGLAQTAVYTTRTSSRYATQPEVVHYAPSSGEDGESFVIHLNSSTDLCSDQRTFRVLFGSKRQGASLRGPDGNSEYYQLVAEVPPLDQTGCTYSRVPVYLHIEDESGQETTVEAGTFTYKGNSVITSPPRSNTKRKLSVDEEDLRGHTKRNSGQLATPIRPKSEEYGYGYDPAHSVSQYTGYSGSNSSSGVSARDLGDKSYGLYSGYDTGGDHHPHSTAYQTQTSPRGPLTYTYASGGPSHHAAQSWQGSAAPTRQYISGADHRSLPGGVPSDAPNPVLIRTSTLQQSHGPNGGGFNPYAGGFPQKAFLKINGHLEAMAQSWSSEEWESKRRLVRFWREQKGNTVVTNFQPVSPSEKQPNMICVSCIWWQEKNQCYITSVDCIALLESLIAVRFTVEEKNRIRRNLEGFKPETVSKAKADSEDFFKLIMSFPNPKPRNIEKDVKVFPWAILPQALKKIIGKYSASYSSTAAAIPPSSATIYPGPSHPPSDASHLRNTPSPATLPDNTTTGLHGSLQPGSSLASPISISRVSGPADGHISLPLLPPAGSHLWQQQQHSLPATPHAAVPTLTRAPWDYMDGPASAPPGSLQAVYYERPQLDEREPVSAGPTGHSSQQQQTLPNINVP